MKDEDILTTGQAAKLLRISIKSVIQMIDRKHLYGWTIPGSKHRRVRKADVLAFAKQNGIPIDKGT